MACLSSSLLGCDQRCMVINYIKDNDTGGKTAKGIKKNVIKKNMNVLSNQETNTSHNEDNQSSESPAWNLCNQ